MLSSDSSSDEKDYSAYGADLLKALEQLNKQL